MSRVKHEEELVAQPVSRRVLEGCGLSFPEGKGGAEEAAGDRRGGLRIWELTFRANCTRHTICILCYNACMEAKIQARLDSRSQAALKRLTRRLGWNPSRIVREGLRILDSCYGRTVRGRVIGVGRFESGLPDLGSNKKHLEGFGQ